MVLSPEVAEILAALGIEDRIVGLTTECTYPPALADIPKVGAFGAVKLESVISLNPGIVFVSGLEQDGLAQDLSRLGFRVERVYPESAAGILSEITRIGEITDSEDAAKTLVANMKAEMDSIRAANSGKSIPQGLSGDLSVIL
ncbi:MAG: ABC transporter substrate-binding protein [Candidatus Cloacimonetes bacterium]|nr:ABC transporter substrate-binding protein [Candidatus Cloacimonadota bacterium]